MVSFKYNQKYTFLKNDIFFLSLDIQKDLETISKWMDFSNKHPADPLFNSTFRGQPGYFKDEMGSSTLHQMIALRTKCYFLQAIPSPLLETAKKESFDNCYINI